MKLDMNSSVEDILLQLNEVGFKINDMKRMNMDSISLDAYESLLNYSIDFVTIVKDAYINTK